MNFRYLFNTWLLNNTAADRAEVNVADNLGRRVDSITTCWLIVFQKYSLSSDAFWCSLSNKQWLTSVFPFCSHVGQKSTCIRFCHPNYCLCYSSWRKRIHLTAKNWPPCQILTQGALRNRRGTPHRSSSYALAQRVATREKSDAIQCRAIENQIWSDKRQKPSVIWTDNDHVSDKQLKLPGFVWAPWLKRVWNK